MQEDVRISSHDHAVFFKVGSILNGGVRVPSPFHGAMVVTGDASKFAMSLPGEGDCYSNEMRIDLLGELSSPQNRFSAPRTRITEYFTKLLHKRQAVLTQGFQKLP